MVKFLDQAASRLPVRAARLMGASAALLALLLTSARSASGESQAPGQCREGERRKGGRGNVDCIEDNGGWDPTASPDLDTSFCNIKRVILAGDAEWIHRSGLLSRPAIFVRSGGKLDNARARRATERASLLATHGEDTVILSSANTYSYDKRHRRLKDYLNLEEYMAPRTPDTLANETWYMFGDNDHGGWKDVFEAYVEPPYYHDHEKLTGYETALSFGIGGGGTGVPFHVHGGGFSEVLWGRKRWFLAPVGVTPRFDPNRTTLYWFHNDYRETVPANMSFLGGLYDCVIGPGEILWFPANWYHATLNIGQTVFMSTFV